MKESDSFADVLIKDIPHSEILSFFRVFSRNERNIISVLSYTPFAMTTKEIRNFILERMFDQVLFSEEIRKSKGDWPLATPVIILHDAPTGPQAAHVKKGWHDYLKAEKKGKPYQPYEELKSMNKLLSEIGMETPGFRTIERALNNLKDAGFVIFRPVKNDKRAKGYWTLNPKINKFIRGISQPSHPETPSLSAAYGPSPKTS